MYDSCLTKCDGCGELFLTGTIEKDPKIEKMFSDCEIDLCQKCYDLESTDQYNDHQRHAYF